MYTYKAKVIRVVDGDTVYLEVDLGFYLKATMSFRLVGINAPELRDAQGPAAKQGLSDLLSAATELVVDSYKADSFGRWLCNIYDRADMSKTINQRMIDSGFATVYVKK